MSKTPTRHIILHNHLFKNAGTSVDQILRHNFVDRWITKEFEGTAASKTSEIEAWFRDNPHAVAFSSHTIQAPLPQMEDVRIIPIVMLRNPVDRIASAYRFERTQDADTRGAMLARQNDFAGYVHARLLQLGDRQCRNFQTARISTLSTTLIGTELARACSVASEIFREGVLGLVSEFDASMSLLTEIVKPYFPSFEWHPVTANASNRGHSNTVSPDMRALLEKENNDDFILLKHARNLIYPKSDHVPLNQPAGT